MNRHSGIDYFFYGFQLIKQKGLKRFIFFPLLINIVLFTFAIIYLVGNIQEWIDKLLSYIPNWLSGLVEWASYLLWPMALIVILLLFSYLFLTVANWIAAPFNGLLAEKVEEHLRGHISTEQSLWQFFKEIPRILKREISKLLYYIPRALGYLLLFFILPVGGQIVWFLFTAWMMTLQYVDYAFDNNKVDFDQMKLTLNQNKGLSFSFGMMVNLFAMIPIINFLVMPVAVCGATAMWVERLSSEVE